MITLDTNVAIYAFGDDDTRRGAALATLAECSFVSVQVLNEFAHAMRRKHKLSFVEVIALLDELREVVRDVQPIDAEANRLALRIAERYRLSFYDALLLAVAMAAGAETIYSEDMQHGLVIDGRLRIANPFLQDAE